MASLFSAKRLRPGVPVESRRTAFEQDYDRILFSTPVRRLADKTQVFPLDLHDSVRSRLTHSHEVSNLARSFGVALIHDRAESTATKATPAAERDVPALLAAAGLAHDLGNPPFGHQGEVAIREWFEMNQHVLHDVKAAHRNDFLQFDGNAQTLRLVTRLQLVSDEYGMDLTCATLTALTKYPTTGDRIAGAEEKDVRRKKLGVFASEASQLKDAWDETGLGPGLRHPFSYIVEACDDLAYSVLDIEDAVKKNLTSFGELMFYLRHHCVQEKIDDPLSKMVLDNAEAKHREYRSKIKLSPGELNDISTQRFRTYAIEAMMNACLEAYIEHAAAITKGEFTQSLMEASAARVLCKALKDFAFTHAYVHRSVVEKELVGRAAIHQLMTAFWRSVEAIDPDKRRPTQPNHRYVWDRISENYRRVFETNVGRHPELQPYYRLQLITDMISGMTDSYLLQLREDLRKAGVLGA